MSEIAIWFERKFSFEFPAELYPNLCARLRGTPARLEEVTRGVSLSELTLQTEGKWSIQENAGHMFDLEELWAARIEDYRKRAERLTAAELTNRKTHEARHNERTLAEILAAFRRARLAWVARLDNLKPHEFAQTALHPRLEQTLRLVDHLYFVAEHDDHHLARIWELRRSWNR